MSGHLHQTGIHLPQTAVPERNGHQNNIFRFSFRIQERDMVRTGRYFLTVSALIISGLLDMTILSGSAAQATQNEQGAHQFSFTSIEGNPMPFSQYKGRVLVVVNTASRCGFTPQYEGLQKLWETYRSRGLVVLGVPSGDFGGQELATDEKIKEFCTVNFSIDFCSLS